MNRMVKIISLMLMLALLLGTVLPVRALAASAPGLAEAAQPEVPSEPDSPAQGPGSEAEPESQAGEAASPRQRPESLSEAPLASATDTPAAGPADFDVFIPSPDGGVSPYGYGDSGFQVEPLPRRTGLYAEAVLPSRYSSEDNGWLSPIKDQGQYGTCWSFAAMAVAEANMVSNPAFPHTRTNADFSELHFAYFHYHRQPDPLGNTRGDLTTPKEANYLQQGGNAQYLTASLANWEGPAHESVAPYRTSNPSSLSASLAFSNIQGHMQDSYWVPMNNPDEVKSLLMQHGAAVVSYMEDSYYRSYKSRGAPQNCYYNNTTTGGGHAVTLVGWDDNFATGNFRSQSGARPSRPGAWLIKNSWGQSTDNGTFWLSYEDVSLRNVNTAYFYLYEKADNYDNQYYYDGSSGVSSVTYAGASTAYTANIFTAAGYEKLEAVSVRTLQHGMSAQVEIYTGLPGTASPTAGVKAYASAPSALTYTGYHTLELGQAVNLKPGELYSVVVTLSSNSGEVVRLPVDTTYDGGWVRFTSVSKAGQSFISNNKDAGWYDAGGDGNYNTRVRAFTSNADGPSLNAPTNLRIATQPERDSISFIWNGVENASGYEVYHALENGSFTRLAAVSGTAYTHTGLSPEETHQYKVLAKGSIDGISLTSDYSNTLSVTTAAGPRLPAPAPVRGDAPVTSSQTSIKWNAVEGAASYDLYVRKGTAAERLLETVPAATLSYTHTGLDEGSTYVYRLRAKGRIDGYSVTSAFSNELSITTMARPKAPAAPTGLAAALDEAGAGVRLTWNGVTGAAGYELQRRIGSGGWQTLSATASPADDSIARGAAQSWRVRAYALDEDGTAKLYSPYGAEVSLQSPPATLPAPGKPVAAAGSGKTVVSWEAVPGATGYELQVVERYTDPESGEARETEPAPLGASESTSYTHNRTTAGIEYLYSVRAVAAAGACRVESGYSPYSEVAVSLPGQPTGLKVQWMLDGHVLVWEPTEGLDGYVVQRRVIGGAVDDELDSDNPVSPYYVDLGAVDADDLVYHDFYDYASEYVYRHVFPVRDMDMMVTYAYQVLGYVETPGGERIYSEPTQPVEKGPLDVYSKPPGSLAASTGLTGTTLSWTPPVDMFGIVASDGFFVFRLDPGAGQYKPVGVLGKYSAPRFTDTGLAPGRQYSYRVTNVWANFLYDERGFPDESQGLWGPSPCKWYASLTVSTPPDAPAAFTAAPAYGDSPAVTLSWQPAEGAGSYLVERYNTTAKSYVTLAATEETSYRDSAVNIGASYSYRVRAVGAAGGVAGPGTAECAVKLPAAPVGALNFNLRGLTLFEGDKTKLAATLTGLPGMRVRYSLGEVIDSLEENAAPADYLILDEETGEMNAVRGGISVMVRAECVDANGLPVGLQGECRVDVYAAPAAPAEYRLEGKTATVALFGETPASLRLWTTATAGSLSDPPPAPLAKPVFAPAPGKPKDAEAAEKWFSLRVVDGRTIEVAPKPEAAALAGDSKALRGVAASYKVRLAFEGDASLAASEVLTLKVNKKLPTAKSVTLKINSFVQSRSGNVLVNGAAPLELRQQPGKEAENTRLMGGATPWMALDCGAMRATVLTEGARRSAKLYMEAQLPGYPGHWRPFRLTVSAVNTVPGLKLSSTSIKLFGVVESSKGVQLTLKPKNSKDTLTSLGVRDVVLLPAGEMTEAERKTYLNGADGCPVQLAESYNSQSGAFRLGWNPLLDDEDVPKGTKKVLLGVRCAGGGTVKLPVSIASSGVNSAIKLTPSTTKVTLNPGLNTPDSVAIALKPSQSDFVFDDVSYTDSMQRKERGRWVNIYAGYGYLPLKIEKAGANIIISIEPRADAEYNTSAAASYRVKVKFFGYRLNKHLPASKQRDQEITINVNTQPDTTRPAMKATLKGSLNLTSGTVATVGFKFSGCNTGVGEGGFALADAGALAGKLDVVTTGAASAMLSLMPGESLATGTYSFKLKGRLPSGEELTSNEVKLKVSASKPALSLSAKTVTLCPGDKASAARVRIVSTGGARAIDPARVEILAGKGSEFYSLRSLGGGWYEITAAPGAKKLGLKLGIYLEGNSGKYVTTLTVNTAIVK